MSSQSLNSTIIQFFISFCIFNCFSNLFISNIFRTNCLQNI
nr:MAG TPA: hypothetical protein [Bacteriophage sp.]